MKKLLCFLCLLATTNSHGMGRIVSEYGSTTVKGHVTVGGYATTRNNFEDDDSENLTDLNELGVAMYHTFNPNFSVALYSTTDNFLDYGFLQARVMRGANTFGLRGGRINVTSGLFAGYGPYSDDMNFLPQGTEPTRVGAAFYRFDGIQAYTEIPLGMTAGFIAEISYGEHVISSEKGVYEPAFFSIFERDSLTAEFNKPATLINLNLFVGNFEFLVNYSDMEGNLKGRYVNNIPLEYLTGNPADVGQFFNVDEDIKSDEYPSRLLKVAMSYSFTYWEHMFTYFRWVDTPEPTFIGENSLGSKYESIGFTYMVRYSATANTILYGGYSEYRGTFGNEQVSLSLKTAPEWVDEGQSLIFGAKWQATNEIHFIAESHVFKGGIFLSGEFQDPNTAQEYWSLYSLTANILF